MRIYIDDIIGSSRSIEDDVSHLIVVFDCIQESGLKIKSKTCVFGATQVRILGYRVSAKGAEPDPEKSDVF